MWNLKNNPAKFHPDQIWNEGAVGFFEEVTQQEQQQEDEQQYEMTSRSINFK